MHKLTKVLSISFKIFQKHNLFSHHTTVTETWTEDGVYQYCETTDSPGV